MKTKNANKDVISSEKEKNISRREAIKRITKTAAFVGAASIVPTKAFAGYYSCAPYTSTSTTEHCIYNSMDSYNVELDKYTSNGVSMSIYASMVNYSSQNYYSCSRETTTYTSQICIYASLERIF